MSHTHFYSAENAGRCSCGRQYVIPPRRGQLVRAILRAAHEDETTGYGRRPDDAFEWFASAEEMAEGIALAWNEVDADEMLRE